MSQESSFKNYAQHEVELAALLNCKSETNRLRDRFVMLEDNVIGDLESMQDNIDTIGESMRNVKQEILAELTPIINGILSENAILRDQVSMLSKNISMFREKLKISEDEPYDAEYDYVAMKTQREQLHGEFKNIYRFFKKSLVQTYAPVAVAIEINSVPTRNASQTKK